MSPMTKAFWLPGLKVVHHTRWIDQKSWCPSNRCSEWFLRPSSPALPGTGWTSWQRMPIHLPQTLSSAEIRCFSPAPEYWAFSLNIHCFKSVLIDYGTMAPPWYANGVILNQVDLEGLRTVSSDRGRAMAAELGLPYFETSAATGQGCI